MSNNNATKQLSLVDNAEMVSQACLNALKTNSSLSLFIVPHWICPSDWSISDDVERPVITQSEYEHESDFITNFNSLLEYADGKPMPIIHSISDSDESNNVFIDDAILHLPGDEIRKLKDQLWVVLKQVHAIEKQREYVTVRNILKQSGAIGASYHLNVDFTLVDESKDPSRYEVVGEAYATYCKLFVFNMEDNVSVHLTAISNYNGNDMTVVINLPVNELLAVLA